MQHEILQTSLHQKLFFMFISSIEVAVTPHIAYCHTVLTGSNEVNSDLSVL